MRLILALFPMVLVAQDGFGYIISFGFLLNAKNLLLAGAILLVLIRIIRKSRFRVELPAIQALFAVRIGYAVLTWWVASFVVQYEQYPIVENALFLKVLLIDYFLIFLAFFYGPRTEADVMFVLKALLAVVFLSQIFTVGEATAILPTHFVTQDSTGRTNGLISHVNAYALLTVLFIPVLVAAALGSRGIMRAVWWSAVLLSFFSLVLTFSRGAFVALVLGAAVWTYVFRRQLSSVEITRTVAAVAIILVASGAYLATTRYGDVLYKRLTQDTLNSQDVWDLSAGRTGIWVALFDRMAETPISFLTGFGWRAYWSLPHPLSPHNSYLEAWFDLGLPGLFCLIGTFLVAFTAVRRSARDAKGLLRLQLSAAVFGISVVAIGLFFGEWYEPWPYFCAYLGLTMRMTILAGGSPPAEERSGDVAGTGLPSSERRSERKQFGWSRPRV